MMGGVSLGDLALVVLPVSLLLNAAAFRVVLGEVRHLHRTMNGDADRPGVLTRLALIERWQKEHRHGATIPVGALAYPLHLDDAKSHATD